MFSHPDFDDHEQVMFWRDHGSGLRAIVAIHRLRSGRALGGTRVYDYASEDDAIRDVLRLSRGMTAKSALAGLECGGAKAVIIGDPERVKSPEALRAFGRFVDGLGGAFVTAEDVGMGSADLLHIKEGTRWVLGTDPTIGEAAPYTALGVFSAMRGALEFTRGSDSFAGLTVAVQGAGHVGSNLCRLLHEGGADLVVADVDRAAVDRVAADTGARVVEPAAIHAVAADVYSPCALGGTLNAETVEQIQARIVVGAANNQLRSPVDGQRLHERGITYVADFLASAGGIISGFHELQGSGDAGLRERIAGIRETAREVLELARDKGIPSSEAADMLAAERAAA